MSQRPRAPRASAAAARSHGQPALPVARHERHRVACRRREQLHDEGGIRPRQVTPPPLLPARDERARAVRRRRARRGPARTRASVRSTRRNGERATGPGAPHRSHPVGAHAAARAAASRTSTSPTRPHTPHRRGSSDVEQAHPPTARGGCAHDCVDFVSDYSAADGGAASSSRRSGRTRSTSAGTFTGMNRPRGPRRGTTRYVVGTLSESSWYSRSSCTAGSPSTCFSTTSHVRSTERSPPRPRPAPCSC